MVQVVEQRTVVILVSWVPMTTEGLSVCSPPLLAGRMRTSVQRLACILRVAPAACVCRLFALLRLFLFSACGFLISRESLQKKLPLCSAPKQVRDGLHHINRGDPFTHPQAQP